MNKGRKEGTHSLPIHQVKSTSKVPAGHTNPPSPSTLALTVCPSSLICVAGLLIPAYTMHALHCYLTISCTHSSSC